MYSLIVAALLAAGPSPGGGDAPAQGAAPPPAAAPAPEGTGPAPADGQAELEADIARELGAPPPTAAVPAPPAARRGRAGAQAAPAADQAPTAAPGGNPYARLLLMPDLSAIGSVALAWNHLDVERLSPRGEPFAPAHQLRPVFQELEVGLQAVVDPFARADVFLTFTPDGAGVEEAYVTTLSLPAGLQLRAGQLYAPFGRLNLQHAHTWDFIDRPLALARLLAVGGLSGPGADLSWLAPVPWFAELHFAYQALTPAFDSASHPAGVARLVQFFDLGAATALGLGLSAARVTALEEGASRDLLGADLFVKVRPGGSRSWLALQAELIGSHVRGGTVAGGPGGRHEAAGTSLGGYAQAVYRDGPFLAYGVRYERAPGLEGGPENRVSALLSFLRSEFERIRLQLSYDRLPGGQDGLEGLLQLEFAIGAHGAHPF